MVVARRINLPIALIALFGTVSSLLLVLLWLQVGKPAASAGTAHLTAADRHLAGAVDSTLSAKITYDTAKQEYVFNAAGKKSTATTPAPPGSDAYKKRVGLYSVDLPVDPSKGFTYYNNDLGLSFTIVPRFPMGRAQLIGGHVVYPLADGGQAVYSVKGNGLEEDIILHSPVSAATYKYQLHLPDTLEAKSIPNSGSIGIYSADARLFEHISYSTAADRQKVEAARQNSSKTNLAFALPAPVIKQNNPGPHNGTGNVRFAMSGNSVIVIGEGLRNLSYPISLDPSVVINTTAGFEAGNNEGNIDFGTNQIKRGGLTGGALGAWIAATQSLPIATEQATSVAYNGYLYEIGGYTCTPTCGAATATVDYAAINADGSLGAWTPATSLLNPTYVANSVVYNGYVYEIGGVNTAYMSAVEYALVCTGGNSGTGGCGSTPGTLGTWVSTTSLPQATGKATAVAYDGYIYEIGGCTASSCGSITAAVDYAPVHADGGLGAWTATTSLPAATHWATSVAYNGYLYEIGGDTGTTTTVLTATVDYAPINGDGTIGSWAATTSLPAATEAASSVVNSGYVYLIGGTNGSITTAVDYAPIYANGTVGTWSATTSLPTAYDVATAAVYKGYVYNLGGSNGTNPTTDVDYVQIVPAGSMNSWGTTTVLGQATQQAATVVYNGYIYEIGGNAKPHSSLGLTTKVYYASLSATGGIGGWSSTTALPTAIYQEGAAAYNGYLYVLGGGTSNTSATPTAVVDYAAIASNGTVGTWTATTSLPVAVTQVAATAYNGYLYEVAGSDSENAVHYIAISSSGTLAASWSTSTNTFGFGVSNLPFLTAYGGHLYMLDSNSGYCYATINSDGSVGAWAVLTGPSGPILSTNFAVYNGYAYAIAGCAMTCGSDLATVYMAPINTGGTFGTWVGTAALPLATTDGTSAIWQGYAYEMGGCQLSTCTDNACSGSSCPVATTYYAAIGNGGDGTVTSWTATTSLPAIHDETSSAVYNGHVYVIGGYTTATTGEVDYNSVKPNGSLGATWAATSSLGTPTDQLTSVAYNGYLYAIGGYTSATTAVVSYAPINANGSVGTWIASTSLATGSLPVGTDRATSVAYNGYLYVLGGTNDGTTQVSTVYYAPINANGSVGAWTALTGTPLPTATEWATSVVYNGYLYEIGGCGPVTCPVTTVDYAPINANGTLGAWVQTNGLPVATDDSASVVEDGYVYEIGGCPYVCSPIATVLRAPLLASGGVGNWMATAALPAATYDVNAVMDNGYVYAMGGNNGSTSVATVDYASLNAIPRIGHYSRLIDLGVGTATLTTIGYTGTLPGGLSAISYATAPSGAIFGSQALSSTLTGSNGATNIEYVWAFATLDDSGSGGFPDSAATTYSNLTSLTINYTVPCSHPAPAARLRGGKSFSSGAQTPLDTCFP